MKTIHRIKCGSSTFFSKFKDYKPKDIDWVIFVDKVPGEQLMWRVKIKDDDLMMYHINATKQQFIDDTLTNPLKIGKFLSPEFSEYIGFTIEDLKLFKNLINHLDNTHKYQKVIYDSYLENGSFTLTDEQLDKAYKEYKKYRV